MSDRDCQHGQLTRVCDRCADASEIEQLRAELAASREREARMREAVRGLLDALPSATTHPAIKAARAALAEGAQG